MIMKKSASFMLVLNWLLIITILDAACRVTNIIVVL